MVITVSNVITIEKPSVEIQRWCEANLILNNPEFSKKLRMHLWLGNTPEKLYLYSRDGDKLILPYGTLRKVLEIAEDCEIKTEFTIPQRINYKCDIPLYDYQEEAKIALKKAHYGILQSRAGSGKTRIGLALAAELGRKTLWLTHTKDLLRQSMMAAKEFMDESLFGTITEGQINIGQGITFATVQTMCKLYLPLYKDIWDVVIVDECHRVCGSPTAVTQFSAVLDSLATRHKYGLSATVHRSDGLIKATYALLGEVVHTVPDEAVGDKVMTVSILPRDTGIGIRSECLNYDGTLVYSKLIAYLCKNQERNKIIVSDLITNCMNYNLILSDRLLHLETLLKMLPERLQKQAVMIDGKTKKEVREQALEDMREGKKRFLFATYPLAKEGLDIPRLDRLFLVTPQKDYAIITQAIGRIARSFDGKETPIVYDYVDSIGYLEKSYKKRCTTYKKQKCEFIKE
jgi:superfamily II DNA or RNA helicase